MHILHNHITLGEVEAVMSRSEAERLFEVLKDLLGKGSQGMHGIKLRDSTGRAVTITAPQGSAEPAQKVYGFQSASGWVDENPNL